MELIANYLKSKYIVANNYYVQFLSIQKEIDYDINNEYEFLSKVKNYKVSFIIDNFNFDKLFFDIKSNRPVEIEDVTQGKIYINKISSYSNEQLEFSSGPSKNIIMELILNELIIKHY